MTDVKDTLYRAKCRARQILIADGWHVELLTGVVFDIEASDESLMRKIKICLDAVAKSDMDTVKKAALPDSCRRELWLKVPDTKNFKIIKIKTVSRHG